jgi:hypothetical protein
LLRVDRHVYTASPQNALNPKLSCSFQANESPLIPQLLLLAIPRDGFRMLQSGDTLPA